MSPRVKELNKMSKVTLAEMHIKNGGLMGLATYKSWRKEELISVILEDEKGYLMDPNAALRKMRAAIYNGNYAEAADHAIALDEWLTAGGFPPKDWDHRPTA